MVGVESGVSVTSEHENTGEREDGIQAEKIQAADKARIETDHDNLPGELNNRGYRNRQPEKIACSRANIHVNQRSLPVAGRVGRHLFGRCP